MTNQRETAEPGPFRGWHFLLILMGLFGVMFAVNGVFVYKAVTTFPGEDVEKSYLQGLNYNATLAQRAEQARLGWQAQMGVTQDGIVLRLYDLQDQPISGETIVGRMERSATTSDDRDITFAYVANGEYRAAVSDMAPGRWHVKVHVLDTDTGDVRFTAQRAVLCCE